jgi:hypothetical protein
MGVPFALNDKSNTAPFRHEISAAIASCRCLLDGPAALAKHIPAMALVFDRSQIEGIDVHKRVRSSLPRNFAARKCIDELGCSLSRLAFPPRSEIASVRDELLLQEHIDALLPARVVAISEQIVLSVLLIIGNEGVLVPNEQVRQAHVELFFGSVPGSPLMSKECDPANATKQ